MTLSTQQAAVDITDDIPAVSEIAAEERSFCAPHLATLPTLVDLHGGCGWSDTHE